MSVDREETTAAVTATAAALDVIDHISAAHGPLAFFHSAGCCDGGSVMCVKDGELPISPHDVCLGEIAGAPFYVDADHYERWGRPTFVVEVSPGAAEGFSLEGLEGVHFVTLTRS
jgi:uncharacterized protein (DUF779 family)